MVTPRRTSSAFALAAVFALAGPAARADQLPLRAERPWRLALLLPDWTLNRPDSCCFPTPGVAFSATVSPRLAFTTSAAGITGDHGMHLYTLAAGADLYLARAHLAPYLTARLLLAESDPDEGSTERFMGPLAGAGVEWAAAGGFSAFVEAGAAALRRTKEIGGDTEHDWVGAIRVVLGLGYRFAR